MAAPAGSAPAPALVAVVVTVAAAVTMLLLLDVAWLDGTLVANLIALVTSALAAGCGWWRATRSTGRRRQAWTALSAALGCWVVGEAIWTWLQAIGEEPFPSVADLAYLCFGPLVCLGLVLLPAGGGHVRRLQGALDGLAISGALLLVSWETALGAAIGGAAADQLLSSVISVAYPVMDVAVSVLAVLILSRTRVGGVRMPLALLAVGLVAISVADSAFVYLTATDGYEPGDTIDIAWNVGFGFIALAALLDRDDHRRGPRTTSRDAIVPSGGLLPYLPVAVAVAIVVTEGDPGPAEEIAVLGLIALLLARQYLTLRQNVRLTDRIAAREEELHHLAFHDVLTGLANRALFRDRLEHALELHARDQRPVAVLFIDLDDFKIINDTLGHATGDRLLVRIAERMLATARAGDTVARLGGDEFAVLLESGDDPRRLAQRITEAIRGPFPLGGHPVRGGASTGIVELAGGDPPIPHDELLARADAAMYAAKRSRKGLFHQATTD